MRTPRLVSTERAAIEDFVRDTVSGPVFIPPCAVARLPPASEYGKASAAGGTHMFFCWDESGGPTLVFSTGTAWVRIQDLATAS